MQTAQTKWTVFLKLGSREHLENFRSQGQIYMNSLSYFVQLEHDSVRADEYEGLSTLFQPKNLRMTLEFPPLGRIDVDPADLAGPVRIRMQADLNTNVFCMYALTSPVDGPLLDPRCSAFGDSLVLVLDGPEFLRRFGEEISRKGLSAEAGLVSYYDYETHEGKIGPFRKVRCFEYQKEFRIATRNGNGSPLILQIGDLTDITSEVIPLVEVDSRLDFSWESAREAELV